MVQILDNVSMIAEKSLSKNQKAIPIISFFIQRTQRNFFDPIP